MNSCESPKCPDYRNGKCTTPLDTVNKYSGEDMCPRNPDAIPRGDYEMDGGVTAWVDAKERLPEEAQMCQVLHDGIPITAYFREWEGNDYAWSLYIPGVLTLLHPVLEKTKVTHWRGLPKATIGAKG